MITTVKQLFLKEMELYTSKSSIITSKSQNNDSGSQSAGNTTCRTSETLCLRSIEYIAGVIDGDGCIQVSSINGVLKLKHMRVKLDFRDVGIVARIKSLLNCGTLRYNKNLVTWGVYNIADMRKVLMLLNGHLRLKLPRFHKACACLGITPIIANPKIMPQSGYLQGLIDTDGTVVFNYPGNRIGLIIELQKTIYSTALDLTDAIPGATVRVLPLVKRNQTKGKIFYSVRFSFETVENMIHIYNFVMGFRLYSDFKFYRVSMIPTFLKIRHFQKKPLGSIEHQAYSKWVLDFITYLNPKYTKVSYLDKLSLPTHPITPDFSIKNRL